MLEMNFCRLLDIYVILNKKYKLFFFFLKVVFRCNLKES